MSAKHPFETIVIVLSTHEKMELSLSAIKAGRRDRTGTISSTLRSDSDDTEFNTAVDVIESLVLAHACAGVDVTTRGYIEGLKTCLEKCSNNV